MPRTPIETPVFRPTDGPGFGPRTPIRATVSSWWAGTWKVIAITAMAVFGYAALTSSDRDAMREIDVVKRTVAELATKNDVRLLKYEMREALADWMRSAEIWCERGDGSGSSMKCRMMGGGSWSGASGTPQLPGR